MSQTKSKRRLTAKAPRRRLPEDQPDVLPALGFVRRPENLHVNGVGLKIVGDCLSPQARAGQIAIIEPILPRPGEIAAFWFKGQAGPVVKIPRSELKAIGRCIPRARPS
jgi:hypothetical protein